MHNENLEKAKMLLNRTDNTCVMYDGQIILADKRRGVRPLLDLIENKTDVTGFAAADKVVGKAAAFLYCLLGVRQLYAKVISEPALAVLKGTHIYIEYDQLVPAIQNRAKDGFCPMERAVWDISAPEEALDAIYRTLEQLNK